MAANSGDSAQAVRDEDAQEQAGEIDQRLAEEPPTPPIGAPHAVSGEQGKIATPDNADKAGGDGDVNPPGEQHGEHERDEHEYEPGNQGQAGRPHTPHDVAQQDDGSVHSVHAMSGFSVGLSVDSDLSDADSSMGVERASSSVSVSSSVYEFVEEYGRTFHKYKEGKYAMPNDEQEQNRLDLQHTIMSKVLGGLTTAPIHAPHRVLDLGTGTGVWAIEFAEQNPSSVVLGTDLSPIQPEYVPPNCRFEIDDCEDEWIWSYKFDYVHARYLVPFLADIPKLLRNIYDNLVPGGIVEFQEAALIFQAIDSTLQGTALQHWDYKILEGMRRTGREPLIALRLRELLTDAGFVNVTERRNAVPINTWPKGEDQKLIGAMEMQNLLEVVHGISMNVLCKVLGWPSEEVELLLVRVRENIKDKGIHAYFPFISVWGQKPL